MVNVWSEMSTVMGSNTFGLNLSLPTKVDVVFFLHTDSYLNRFVMVVVQWSVRRDIEGLSDPSSNPLVSFHWRNLKTFNGSFEQSSLLVLITR